MRVSRLLVVLALALVVTTPVAAGPQGTGSVAGSVTIRKKSFFGRLEDKSDRSGVVVYLEGVPGEPPQKKKAKRPEIHQRDKAFVPRVLAVRAGTRVYFPNDDRIFHNVFSLSTGAEFDLGLYKSGTAKSVVFDHPGQVDVYCNIHPDMVAAIKVLDTPWFTVTDKTGAFRLAGVPPGTYPAIAWQARGKSWHGTVTVTAGAVSRISIQLVEGSGSTEHLRKDGTPYGRYE